MGTTAPAVQSVPLRATLLAVLGQAAPVLSVSTSVVIMASVLAVLEMLRPQLVTLGTALVKLALR